MSRQAPCAPWPSTLMQHLPHVSKPQAYGRARWSWGMVLARSCALTAVSSLLAPRWQRKANPLRQRVRDWDDAASANRGRRRQTLEVAHCCAPLRGGVLTEWPGTQMARARAARALGRGFVVWALSVVDRGGAMPVAWSVWPAATRRAWRPAWVRLRRRGPRGRPTEGPVLVWAARGRSAPWRYRRLVRLGGQPFLRRNTGGPLPPDGQTRSPPRKPLVPEPGTSWAGRGGALSGHPRRRAGPLLARGDEGDQDPWRMVPTLAPEAREGAWDGGRAWMAHSFQGAKRGGWQWQRTRRTEAERATRRWWALAVATRWLWRGGGEAEETSPDSTRLEVTGRCPERRRAPRTRRWRLGSVFRRGWHLIVAALRRQEPWPQGRFIPDPWPTQRAPDEEASLPLRKAAESHRQREG